MQLEAVVGGRVKSEGVVGRMCSQMVWWVVQCCQSV